MKYNAIVLLGEHNTGKDTLGNFLVSIVPGAGIVKFGGLNKYLVARMFDKSVESMEDKTERQQKVIHELSPLTMLNLLFQAGQLETPEAEALRKSYRINAITAAASVEFPIFTDIRRQEELNEVKARYNPFVVFLFAKVGFQGKSGDEFVRQMWLENDYDWGVHTVGIHSVEHSQRFLLDGLAAHNIKTIEKPKVYLRNKWRHVMPGTQWISYDSFMDMFAEAGGLLEELSESTAHAMVEAFLRNANAHEIKSYLGLEDDKSYSMLKCDPALLMLNTIAKTHDIYIEIADSEGDFIKYNGVVEQWN